MLQQEIVVGPLRIDLRELETRSICASGVELIRRVYFAVRDPAWGTIQPEVRTREFEQRGGGFVLTAYCLYRADLIELDAQIRISASAEGFLRFESTAIAKSSFSYNRIGFCVLHPPADFAGATIVLDDAEEVSLPPQILPQIRVGDTLAPAVGPFTRLTVKSASGARTEFRFEGDLFELEDQRNWTDGSFKTYGTPQALGAPPPLERGAELRQSVDVRVIEQPRRPVRRSSQAIAELTLGKDAPTPTIGLSAGSKMALGDIAMLIRPDHLRVDLRDGRSALAGAFRLAAALECGIQLGVHLPLADEERDSLRGLGLVHLINSVLVLNQDAEQLTAETDAEAMRQLIDGLSGEARLWTGTDAYYAQVNRNLRPGLGGNLTFSIQPQVHASDEQSLLETLEIQRDVVLDLRAKQPGCRVSIGAVTLGPRRNFSAPPGVAVGTQAPDPRQSTLFGAVWSLASVRYLSEANVDEVTYHTLTGVGGLIDDDGRATPLLHLFADLADLDERLTLLESTAPLRCTGVAFTTSAALTLLIANLHHAPLPLRLPFASGGVLRRLNTTTLAFASNMPASFHDSREVWRGDTIHLDVNEFVRLEVHA